MSEGWPQTQKQLWAFVPSQGQNLFLGDISDAVKLEQLVTTLEGTSEILPLSLWTGKQKPWAWKILAQDPESGLEPRLLAPAHCPFTEQDFLYLLGINSLGLWSLTFGQLPLSLNPTIGAAPFYHLACFPANLKLQAPICRAEIAQGLAGHWGIFGSCSGLWDDPLEQVLYSFFTFPSFLKNVHVTLLMVKQNKAEELGDH